jgi:hypothetical protein
LNPSGVVVLAFPGVVVLPFPPGVVTFGSVDAIGSVVVTGPSVDVRCDCVVTGSVDAVVVHTEVVVVVGGVVGMGVVFGSVVVTGALVVARSVSFLTHSVRSRDEIVPFTHSVHLSFSSWRSVIDPKGQTTQVLDWETFA